MNKQIYIFQEISSLVAKETLERISVKIKITIISITDGMFETLNYSILRILI